MDDYEPSKEARNLATLLGNGIKVEDLVAVRAISNSKTYNQGDRYYAQPYSPTIHFSLNHFVDEAGVEASWDDCDTVILSPFKKLIGNNPDTFFGGSTVDIFCVGYADLLGCQILRKNGESPEVFKQKVNRKIEEIGYLVLPGGMWGWDDNWDASTQLQRVLDGHGFKFTHHRDTNFYHSSRYIYRGRDLSGHDATEVRKTLLQTFLEMEHGEEDLRRFAMPFNEWLRYWHETEGHQGIAAPTIDEIIAISQKPVASR